MASPKGRSEFSGPADFGVGVLARCERSGAIGAALANSTIAAGSRCLYVDGDVAAVLVMAFTNPHLGPLAIKLLRDGLRTGEVVEILRQHDRHFAHRQMAMLPVNGTPDTFCGDSTPEFADCRIRSGVVALGNGLPDDGPIEAAIAATAACDGSLETRLVAGLSAAVGHLRPEAEIRSASLYVGLPGSPRRTDLRVDLVDDPAADSAVDRLARTLAAYEPLIPYYQALPDDPEIGSWRDKAPELPGRKT